MAGSVPVYLPHDTVSWSAVCNCGILFLSKVHVLQELWLLVNDYFDYCIV